MKTNRTSNAADEAALRRWLATANEAEVKAALKKAEYIVKHGHQPPDPLAERATFLPRKLSFHEFCEQMNAKCPDGPEKIKQDDITWFVWPDGTTAREEFSATLYGQMAQTGNYQSFYHPSDYERYRIIRSYWVQRLANEEKAFNEFRRRIVNEISNALRYSNLDVQSDAEEQLKAGIKRIHRYRGMIAETDQLIYDTPEHREQVARESETQRYQAQRQARLRNLMHIRPDSLTGDGYVE